MDFLKWLREEKLPELEDKEFVTKIFTKPLEMSQIVKYVADYYKLVPDDLTKVVKGPKKGSVARKVAMYLCQQLGGYPLRDIRVQFGLSNIGSVSYITSQIRTSIKEDKKLEKQIQNIKTFIINDMD